MINYRDYEKHVYDWLKRKHGKDNSFTFSVRRNGSKGAERDYFIGTEKSNYFGTTFWTLPINFPGSSSDCINLIFGVSNEQYTYLFEFSQTNSPDGTQNKLALELIVSLKDSHIKNLGFSHITPDGNKMFSLKTTPRQSRYESLDTMLVDIDKDLEIIIPTVNNAIDYIKNESPEFVAHRISLDEYDKMQKKLEKRFLKYKENQIITSSESEMISIIENEKRVVKVKESPLNRILYGPPGTGKTYYLKDQLFDKYTLKETSITKEQHFETVVSGCSWWQVIAIALLDLKKAKVSDIHNNKWVQKKASLSNSKTIRPTLWGQLQSHTINECEFVNVADRQQPLIFSKTKDSHWEISEELVTELVPELYDLKDSVDNYNPDPDKVIKHYDFVTFHQSFAYEDFIEGIKPILPETDTEEAKDLGFKIEDGVFKIICTKAKNDPDNRYAIFIDEINRGNVSAIFGELITLIEIDKRQGAKNELSIKLPYSKKEFSVPSNLDIYGTMNTADRSVEALDTALRRRFDFIEMMPDHSVIQEESVGAIKLSEVLKIINQRIELLRDRDHTIGHSYFVGVNTEDKLANAFNNKIVPLLQEYFYGDYGKIGLVLGSGFVEKLKNHNIDFASFDYENANDYKTASYHLIQVNQNTVINAVEILLGKKETISE